MSTLCYEYRIYPRACTVALSFESIFCPLSYITPSGWNDYVSTVFKKTLGSLALQNHLVMSPMTRNRAIGNIPNELIAEYYDQRASAGLIVTEGASPSPMGWVMCVYREFFH